MGLVDLLLSRPDARCVGPGAPGRCLDEQAAGLVAWSIVALGLFVFTVALGVAASWAIDRGLVAPRFALALLTLATVSLLLLLVFGVRARVGATEESRRRAELAHERALRASEGLRTQLQAVIQHMPAGLAIAEAPSGRLILGNDQMEEIWRRPIVPLDSVDDYRSYRGFHPDGRAYAPQDWPLARAVLHGEQVGEEEIEIERGDGSRGWISVNAAPICEGGQVVAGVAVFADITVRRDMEQAAKRLASRDSLTGLANRKLFEDLLDKALALARREGHMVALILLDLDNFKDVNDTLGHPVGDIMLCTAARRIERGLRASDTLARLGGDEFACILGPLPDPAVAGGVAAKLLRALAAPVEVDGHPIPLAASAGIALFPADGTHRVELLKHADLALYKAKNGGRNRYRFFEPQMDQEAQARRSLERLLRRAVADDALVFHYQPQLDLATGRFTAAEALLRWPHPDRGFISPEEFIPVAEASGFIRALGAWSVGLAAREARRWREQGLDVTLALNISAAQLRGGETLEVIRATFDGKGLGPGWVELELTESLLVDALEADTRPFLDGIVQMGVPLTVDDFGTGYSSLASLRRLPVQKIKIDRSFVHDLDRNPEAYAVVQAIVAMGRALGKTIVAEGVETLQQLRLVRDLGCHMAQGFLLAAPMEAQEMARLLRVRGRPVAAA